MAAFALRPDRLVAVAVWVLGGAVALVSPSAHAMSLNDQPVIDLLGAEPDTVAPGGTSLLTCIAHDDDGSVVKYQWSATGGTFPGGLTTEETLDPDNTIIWTAPVAEGSYVLSCTVVDDDDAASTASQVTMDVTTANAAPTIGSLTAEETDVTPGQLVPVSCVASDPDGDDVTFSWQASAGAISDDGDADPENITFTAPTGVVRCFVAVTVTDTNGASASRIVWFDVALGTHVGTISASLRRPLRLAAAPWGEYFVTDGSKVLVFDPDGTLLREMTGFSRPLGIAVSDAGELFVAEAGTGGIRVFDGTPTGGGAFLRTLASPRTCALPSDMCLDGEGRLFVTDAIADFVWVFDTAGGVVTTFGSTGKGPGQLNYPTGIAYDLVAERILVADQRNRRVQVFDRDGTWLSNIEGGGSGWEFAYVQGLAVCPHGRVFVADSFQGYVAAVTQGSAWIGTMGSFGTAPGQLKIPNDAEVDPTGKLLVASTDTGRIEIYQLKDVTGDYGPVPTSVVDGPGGGPGSMFPITPFAGGCAPEPTKGDPATPALAALLAMTVFGVLRRKARRAT